MRAYAILAGVVAVGAMSAALQAAVVPISVTETSEGSYRQLYGSDATPEAYTTYLMAGYDENKKVAKTIEIFQLPDLQGQQIASATFTIHLGGGFSGGPGDAHLLALPDVNSTTVDSSMFDAAPATDQGVLLKSSDWGNKVDYSLDVTSAIQSEYADYANDGVASFRIEIPNVVPPGGTARSFIFTKGSATLTITPVPEPATLSLLGLGGLLLLRRRK